MVKQPKILLGIEARAVQICPSLGKAQVCLYGNEVLGCPSFKVSTSLKTGCEQAGQGRQIALKTETELQKETALLAA